MSFRDRLLISWQKPNALTWLLWPLSLVYRFVFFLRKKLYAFSIIPSYKAPVPVIVVGNLTVGGTGKTPLVIHLVELLRSLGYTPGVISRGYSGQASNYPLTVTPMTDVRECGDEPALIVRRTKVNMVVGPNRQESIESLLNNKAIDIIISDDGLQHLALQRDIELCLLDATSPLTNKHLLPAGPYRESLARLSTVDLIVQHTQQSIKPLSVANESLKQAFSMQLEPAEPIPVTQSNLKLTVLDRTQRVHAVAGIGNPQRFFTTCKHAGFNIDEHEFPDHYQFSSQDFVFNDQCSILMTEKDAVKCDEFTDLDLWFLPVDAVLSDGFSGALSKKIQSLSA